MTFAKVARVPGQTTLITKLGVVALSTPAHGGTYQYTLSMIEALRLARGFDITIYTNSNHYKDVPFPIRPLANSRLMQTAQTLSASVGFRLPEPFANEDVLLAPIYSTALLHTRKPFAFTLHDLQEHHFPQNFSLAQRSWRHTLNGLMAQRAAKILCESQYVKNDIIRLLGVDQQKIAIVVGPPPRQLAFEPDDEKVRLTKAKFNLPDRFLFYPAQFWPHKNHLRLVEAFSKIHNVLPELSLVLTGRENEILGQVLEKAHALGVHQNVLHLGYVEPEEMWAIYKLAAVLVMPSLYESVSIPIFEAFQMGTPVAASSILAIPEQVGDAGIVFDPHSPDAIARSVLSIVTDPAKAAELSRRGRTAMRDLTPERYASQIQLVLDALVSASAVKLGCRSRAVT